MIKSKINERYLFIINFQLYKKKHLYLLFLIHLCNFTLYANYLGHNKEEIKI
jgi:hypothetical protein